MKLLHIEKPELATRYSKENSIELSFLALYSRKNVLWNCENKHSFERPVRDYVRSQSCPECKKDNSIKSNKSLLKEFDKKLNSFNPDSISLGDNRTKIWWKCSCCNFPWEASAWSRNKKQSGCPSCHSSFQHSKNEIRLFSELSFLFNNVEHNYTVEGYKYDIYICDLNILIEYDGSKWHSQPETIKNDLKKNNIAKNNNYSLIRIREKGLKPLSDNDICLEFDTNTSRDKETQSLIIHLLLEKLGKIHNLDFSNYINNKCFVNDDFYFNIINKGIITNNLTLHPKYKEFATELNKQKPKTIATFTKEKFWWRCSSNKKHTWLASPLNRKRTNCPHCYKEGIKKAP